MVSSIWQRVLRFLGLRTADGFVRRLEDPPSARVQDGWDWNKTVQSAAAFNSEVVNRSATLVCSTCACRFSPSDVADGSMCSVEYSDDGAAPRLKVTSGSVNASVSLSLLDVNGSAPTEEIPRSGLTVTIMKDSRRYCLFASSNAQSAAYNEAGDITQLRVCAPCQRSLAKNEVSTGRHDWRYAAFTCRACC